VAAVPVVRYDGPMTDWPQTIPPDLRRRLDGVMGFRSYGPNDVWGEVRDWLVLHRVEAPAKLPEDKGSDVGQDR
jgi:hypothetical protein